MKRGLLKIGFALVCASGLTLASSLMPMQASVAHAQASAQQLTPAQIEQFKQLPRAQQEALARQYGIDLSMLERQGSSRGAQEDPETLRPRDGLTDEQRRMAEEDAESENDKKKKREPELKPFGYNIFAAQPTTFAPVNNAPVPGSYRIGAGDSVLIQMFGQESISHNLVVDREGRLTIPRLGPLTVAGLTYDELKALIQNQVNTRMIGMQAAVSMGELRSMQIFVLGEAHQPGAYTVSSLTTISQALLASGGVSDIASLRNVQLKRSGETIVEFDLYDLLIHGDASKDRLLQPGDAVFIPSRGPLVAVSGEVVRPALYELKAGETLADAMNFAGGALASGHLPSVRVLGVRNGQRQVSTVNAVTQAERLLGDGDEVYVPRISEAVDNAVMLSGAVTRQGAMEWQPGLRINDIIRSPTQDLLPEADLNYGLILREDPETYTLKLYQFDLSSALRGDAQQNLALQPRDEVIVFSRFEEESKRIQAGFATDEEVEEYEEENNEVGLNNSLLPTAERLPKDKLVLYSKNSRQTLLERLFARLHTQGGIDGTGRSVSISGEVRFPREYPMVENASVASFIAAAGGLRDSAYLARAEITRTVTEDGAANTDYIPFNLYDALLGNASVQIRARDQISVFRIPEWQNTVEVILEGEVLFPGTYAVRRGETLLDVVERAGGLTDYAFVEGTVLTREEIREQERMRLASLSQELRQEMASISLTEGGVTNYGELNQLLNDLSGAEPVGRLVVDLAQILSGDRSRDIELRDGDRLVVPGQRRTVSIIGEVQMPSTYRYDESLSVIDYIERTGGVKRRGDDKRIFVVRADGSVMPYAQRRGWFSSTGRVDLRPGDTIVVPLNTSYKDNMELWATSTQILYQMAVAIAAVNSI
ncbi:periplasmic protein involved in polysaccharide export [Idiomarina sp. A28L]|uniref:SLBB domain-containing protein n=1 Tax=Idiomarina sp. A28L TaxID=1036674 RepID=UPI0002138C44|nr:SLBB domain-containing protein [Idiomarina sp. A28L]EGN74601.1 periplasmic protein involved in polysaccharide export [Idiomarina sp. A28L]